jgi:hypothetical protein
MCTKERNDTTTERSTVYRHTITTIRIRDKAHLIFPLRRLDKGYEVSGSKKGVASFTAKANDKAKEAAKAASLAREGK